jgi:predicted TIM-barrel fold metal-dependent hydrolase
MFESESYRDIKKAVDEIRLIDTHEHLIPEKDRVAQDVDVLTTFLTHYVSSDLVSSGMQLEDLQAILSQEIPVGDRWKILAPFWENVRYSGYARAVEIAARDLYGVDRIDEATYADLSRKMKEVNRMGLYRWVLQQKAGIDRCILDPIDELGRAIPTVDVDRSLFAPVMRFDGFIMVNNLFDMKNLSKRAGIAIHSLQDLLKALDIQFERVAKSIFGVKTTLAYYRTIRFDKTDQTEAEKAFNTIFRSQPLDWRPDSIPGSVLMYGPSMEEAKPLQDFMMHRLIQLAAKHRLPVQVHTGLQEGFGNVISNSNPLNLTNLFVEYSEVKFDIFHGGYPYTGELATLAKNFQNVYVDMCWLHIISPSRARSALSEWLETVPTNKILAFGGDYLFVEGVYGHSVLARENVARVLWEKVEEGSMRMKDAKTLANRLLRQNALNLFRIE